MDEHIKKISKALDKNETIVIGAECEVKYHGKVESYLPLGDRMIIIKSDKTMLVHQPSGVAPINYMKEGTSYNISNDGDSVTLQSKNQYLKDYLDIKMNKIHFVSSHLLEDSNKITINGSEADMSDMIYENPGLIEKGFKPFSREEHTQFGFIDVFGTDKNGKIVIIECKRDLADFKAVSQLHRYVHKIAKSKGIKTNQIRGIIASPKISANAEEMLREQGFEYRKVIPPKHLVEYGKSQKKLGEF